MTVEQETITIEMIPVDQIAVINPRIRNKKTFLQIVDSISKVGLKRPITVGRNENGGDEPTYKLVCGQGRLEAFISLGERAIPARIVDVTEEDSQVMSLVENLARRKHRPLELLQDIGELRKRGLFGQRNCRQDGTFVRIRSFDPPSSRRRRGTAINRGRNRTDTGQCRHRHCRGRRRRRSRGPRSGLSGRSFARQEAL